ncbi:MAG: hypothetical protein MUF23_10560 [Pirellula sp.]|jgi:hypothetical protein|nr:hypothetical protein [Pirellula sp.]
MPHRISLRRGWKRSSPEWSAPELWERIFHAPTLPASTIGVRLVIVPCFSGWQIHLNGNELTWSQTDSRLDCEVTHRLERVNRIIVRGIQTKPSHAKEGERQELLSPFDAYLEIYDEE